MIVYIVLPPEASKSLAPKAIATRKVFQTLATCADTSYEVETESSAQTRGLLFFLCQTFLEK